MRANGTGRNAGVWEVPNEVSPSRSNGGTTVVLARSFSPSLHRSDRFSSRNSIDPISPQPAVPPYHSSVSPNPQPGAPTESLAAFFRHSAPKRAHQLSATCRLSRILRPSCYYASVASGAQQRTTTATGRCCYCCRLCRCYSVLLPTSGSAANSH